MTSFLHLVASDLKRRLHNDLSRTVIIFPNKRAGLFLNDFFTPEDDHPTWMPRYMSIREFFATLSDKTTADPIETVCRLYDHYRRLTGSEESLDFFYAWGERLLADFDDVDKNMADPSKIFRDLRDYAETGGFEVLTEEQITQLHTFSKDFAKEKLTVVRQNFVRLWNVILPLYHALREDLAADGLAYEGQLYREAAEQLKAGTATLPVGIEHVVFVGFNVIDRVEQTLFEALSAAGKALFYWDYDVSYARRCGDVRHEAGTFLQENLQRFPNALEETNEAFNNFLRNREKKVIEYAAASTDRGQVQSIEEWLSDSDNFDKKEARETAIVLCDEGLLQPLLHTLPRTINEVNITKGFPLPHTPVFAFIVQEMEAMEDELDQQATTFYSQKKKHGASAATFQLPEGKECIPYLERLVTKIEEETRRITERVAENVVLSNLYSEAFFRVVTTLRRFLDLLSGGHLTVSLPTLLRLVRQVMRTSSIPFHGEPARGLQIMGVLETRCLDFKRILMLSVGEGILPEKPSEASFIPTLIRREYGLTTPEKKISVYAYYFYRLLQRAERVRLVYNDSVEGVAKGEMSRFMKTLLVEHGERLGIEQLRIESVPRIFRPERENAPLATIGEEPLFRKFSPSALKTYFRCKKMFYYKYVLRLKTPQRQDPIINSNDFGTVFHRAAELLLTVELDGMNHPITPGRIRRFFENGGIAKLRDYTLRAFEEKNIKSSEITVSAIVRYLRMLFEYEAGGRDGIAPATSFLIKAVEGKYRTVLPVPFGEDGRDVPIVLEGDIDRLDEATLADGTRLLRVVDYKTGKKKLSNNKPINCTIEGFFTPSADYPANELQVFVYALMFANEPKAVAPLLYYIPSMSMKDYSSRLLFEKEYLTDIRPLLPEFRRRLTEVLAEIIDPKKPFPATACGKQICDYCDFCRLCTDRKTE